MVLVTELRHGSGMTEWDGSRAGSLEWLAMRERMEDGSWGLVGRRKTKLC